MEIIGEKINGTRKLVKQAIIKRDSIFIQDLALKQAKAGAAWLDINAGTHPDQEPDDLVWLVKTVQSVVDIPLCLDTTNPNALEKAIKVTNKTPMINSINGENARLENLIPIVVENKCQVIALAMDEKGIPSTSKERVSVINKIIKATNTAGIPDENIYIDPLVMTISTNIQTGIIFFDTLKSIKLEFPKVHFVAGISNISFGLPVRSHVNRFFLALAMEAGLDTAILDPLDQELKAAILITEMLLGKDNYCLNFTKAFREGVFNKVSNSK
jgi:5-methyltetrahydrofolate--homocysteine methyltransferase